MITWEANSTAILLSTNFARMQWISRVIWRKFMTLQTVIWRPLKSFFAMLWEDEELQRSA